MPKRYSSDEVFKALARAGFSFVSQKGSHVKYRKSGNPTLTVMVPANRKQIPHGTLRSILEQAALDESVLKR
jgi:predicted RNA binding protein YcfA (HicA-like mRNA interferase family)